MSLLGLIYEKKKRKKKKKCQRADRVQWPSFSCRLVRLVSGCHIGHSTASDFRAERAVCWVGGQMEGGCTAQLSSASLSPPRWHTQPLPSSPSLSLPVACPFIYSFSQSFLSSLSHFPSAARHFTVGFCSSVVSL